MQNFIITNLVRQHFREKIHGFLFLGNYKRCFLLEKITIKRIFLASSVYEQYFFIPLFLGCVQKKYNFKGSLNLS
jgi:hypothetical protein